MMKQRVFPLLILVCGFGFALNASASFSRIALGLPDEDKAQIVKSILEQRLSNHKVYPLGRELILSTENINIELIPNRISSIGVSFLKLDEISKRDKGNIRYLVFGEFKETDSGVEVELSEIWRDGIARGWSRTAYKCRKVDGKWLTEEGEESFEIYN
ncbi:MAG TPA: hypothetical protein VF553_14925 [Pyrinomonadaceae bacterium]|jgi:hypothetical protein